MWPQPPRTNQSRTPPPYPARLVMRLRSPRERYRPPRTSTHLPLARFTQLILYEQCDTPPAGRSLVFPDWDAVIDESRPFRLHFDASTDGLGATLEQEQLDGSMLSTVCISRATLSNKRKWTPMELEADCVVWSIRHLRRYLFSVFFLIFTDHECLQQIIKIGESKLHIQRWMQFLPVNNYRLSYRRGRDNANADFLSRLGLLRPDGPR